VQTRLSSHESDRSPAGASSPCGSAMQSCLPTIGMRLQRMWEVILGVASMGHQSRKPGKLQFERAGEEGSIKKVVSSGACLCCTSPRACFGSARCLRAVAGGSTPVSRA
jgi:hypothetical protein